MVFFSIVIVSFFLVLCPVRAKPTEDFIVELNEPKGKVRGHVMKSFHGKNFYTFQEIPYAVPPVGEYRFAEPKPHPGWDGVLNCTKNTKICMQVGVPDITEDCLFLNVYTPVVDKNAGLPILFWIHGGAFMSGTGAYQVRGPEYLMDYGIIVVTFNYRVNLFGFLTTGDGVIPGNVGLKDQLLALKWVNKNIRQFGGDPAKVTLTGQSAGSIAASYHMVSQKSSGLYRSAITESGSALVPKSIVTNAKNYAFQLGRLIDRNFTSKNSRDLLRVLRKAPAIKLQEAADKVKLIGKQVGLLPDLLWGVVMENGKNPNAYITKPMYESFRDGNFERVPVLTGFTYEEILSFCTSLNEVKKAAAKHDRSPANLINHKLHISKANEMIAGDKLKKLYTNKTFYGDLASFISFSSDVDFINPIVRAADLISKYVPVYLYQLSFDGTPQKHLIRVKIPHANGTAHAADLFYLWDFHFPPEKSPNEYDRLNRSRLLKMWTDFIKFQNPTPAADATLGIPTWPPMKSNNLQYLDMGRTLSMRKNPKKYVEVKKIIDEYMRPPFIVY